MTIFDKMKSNGALCEGVRLHRPRAAAALRERSGEARPLSFARGRPRGPPAAG